MPQTGFFSLSVVLIAISLLWLLFRSPVVTWPRVTALFLFGALSVCLNVFLVSRGWNAEGGPVSGLTALAAGLAIALPGFIAVLAGFGYRRYYRVDILTAAGLAVLTLSGLETLAGGTDVTALLARYLYAATSLLFLFAALSSYWQGRSDDMDGFRRQARTWLAALSLLAAPAVLLPGPGNLLLASLFALLWVSTALAIGAAKLAATNITFDDHDDKLEQFSYLFDRRRIYREEDLTLERIGDRLVLDNAQVRTLIHKGLKYRRLSDLLDDYRVGAAKEILADIEQAQAQLEEVAISVGYASLAPFSAAFLRLAGETPRAYRRRHLDKAEENRGLQLTNSDR